MNMKKVENSCSTRAFLGSIKGFVLAISIENFAKEKKFTGNAIETFLKVIIVMLWAART